MSSVFPTNITADRKNAELTVSWNDGHTSVYPFSLLRYACPCAECRGGHEKMTSEPDPSVFTMQASDSAATRIINLEAVGSYAMTIQWEDGHHFGIYNWSYLRALCPCQQCQQESRDG